MAATTLMQAMDEGNAAGAARHDDDWQDDPLRDFDAREITVDGIPKRVYVSGQGPTDPSTGKMVLDKKTFETSLATHPADVQLLFSGDDGSGGAFGSIGNLIESYTRSGGLVADVRQRISTQVQSLTRRIDTLEAQLERRRETLQREFQAADETMAQLNAQMSSLSSLGGQYRLF